MKTLQNIQTNAMKIFSAAGYDGLSIRTLAREAGISLSNMYHYYADKDQLLRDLFDSINLDLGRERFALAKPEAAAARLRQIIEFQFTHAKEVSFVLKYYLHFRERFKLKDGGFIPEKGYKHIVEVLEYGVQRGEFPQMDIMKEARVITHAINGFVLEYYPVVPKGEALAAVVDSLHEFIIRSITAISYRPQGVKRVA
jgi:AcrR family transcriptional regulator